MSGSDTRSSRDAEAAGRAGRVSRIRRGRRRLETIALVLVQDVYSLLFVDLKTAT
jgi:hypothetical protein